MLKRKELSKFLEKLWKSLVHIFSNIIYKTINSDVTGENIKKNLKWLQIPDNPYIIRMTGGTASRKTKASLNFISHQTDIDKIYLHVYVIWSKISNVNYQTWKLWLKALWWSLSFYLTFKPYGWYLWKYWSI